MTTLEKTLLALAFTFAVLIAGVKIGEQYTCDTHFTNNGASICDINN